MKRWREGDHTQDVTDLDLGFYRWLGFIGFIIHINLEEDSLWDCLDYEIKMEEIYYLKAPVKGHTIDAPTIPTLKEPWNQCNRGGIKPLSTGESNEKVWKSLVWLRYPKKRNEIKTLLALGIERHNL